MFSWFPRFCHSPVSDRKWIFWPGFVEPRSSQGWRTGSGKSNCLISRAVQLRHLGVTTIPPAWVFVRKVPAPRFCFCNRAPRNLLAPVCGCLKLPWNKPVWALIRSCTFDELGAMARTFSSGWMLSGCTKTIGNPPPCNDTVALPSASDGGMFSNTYVPPAGRLNFDPMRFVDSPPAQPSG